MITERQHDTANGSCEAPAVLQNRRLPLLEQEEQERNQSQVKRQRAAPRVI